MRKILTPYRGGASVGAAGGIIPIVGDPLILLARKKLPQGAFTAGMKFGQTYIGGPIAVAGGAYTLYDAYQSGWRVKSVRGIPIPYKKSGPSRSSTLTSRGRKSTFTSHRTRKAPSATHRPRNRCRHVDRRGKRCKLPAGHSGRHSY